MKRCAHKDKNIAVSAKVKGALSRYNSTYVNYSRCQSRNHSSVPNFGFSIKLPLPHRQKFITSAFTVPAISLQIK